MVTNIPKGNKPKILVTGANGLLGQKIIENILKGDEFHAIATGKGKSRLPVDWHGYDYYPMDITDKKEAYKVFEASQPDFVIHAASMTDVDRCEVVKEACYEQNVKGTINMVEACLKYNSHLVFVSTDFIFDGKNGPYDEESLPHPVNYYGHTKLEAENAVKKSGLPHTIIRTNLVYGIAHELHRSNIILWVKKKLELGQQIEMVDDQFRTPTLAEDLAIGCLLAVSKKATGIFNISGRDFLTPYEMGILTAGYFDLDKGKIKKTDSTKFSQVAHRPLKTGLTIYKARKVLGFEPRSFTEGIDIMAKQLKLADYKN